MKECDVVIIGSGPAALELFDALPHHSVMLIERGEIRFRQEDQENFPYLSIGKKIRFGPAKTLAETEKNRIRYAGFGGTYNIWGRIWKRLSPYDFEDKPFYPLPSWPISYEEINKYYEIVAKYHNVEEVLEDVSVECKVEKGFETPTLPSLLHRLHTNLHLGTIADRFEVRGDRVNTLIVRNKQGEETKIHAKLFVIAAGTVETTRLLLSQKEFSHPLLGKYLMDHPKGYVGTFFPKKEMPSAKTIDHKELRPGINLKGFPNHALLLKGNKMRFHLEQIPNKKSEIKLGHSGPVINWQLLPEDTTLFRDFFEAMREHLKEFGEVRFQEEELSLERFQDASHQMGTTRMGSTPEYGVVDPNLQFFGLENLFVLSNSVFPTAGSANPTMTLLALARRLGKFISRVL